MGALSPAAHRRHAVRVEEDVGALRRAVARMAAGCAGVRDGEAELVATELATNLLRHTSTGGYVLSRPAGGGIELLAVDRGPGLGRGPSTSRGLGAGLASVERLASTFDLYSAGGEGAVVLARLAVPPPPPGSAVRWGGVNVPLDGEDDSGDAWAVAPHGPIAALVVDGLGHGPRAHEAAIAAVTAFGERPLTDLTAFVRRAHEAMRGTRGGVLGVCTIDPGEDRLTYAGVGNITGRLLVDGASRGLLSREGMVGAQVSVPRAHVVQHRWEPGATLVLASDGLRGHWDLRSYPGLLEHDPVVVAATLQRDHERGTDDATVLVVRDVRRRAR